MWQEQTGLLESAVCEVDRRMELGDVIIVLRRPGPAGWRWQHAAHMLLCYLEEKYPHAEVYTTHGMR